LRARGRHDDDAAADHTLRRLETGD
jgi:hypothetical protein